MEDSTTYLLVGGGVAAVWAAMNIRERDKDGRIIIVGKENHPPYDKPPLTKQMLMKDGYAVDDAYSKFDNFYPDNNIELRLGARATSVDRANRTVGLDNGDSIRYEKLLLSTGSAPRTLDDLPGTDLRNVFYVRTIEDGMDLRTAMQTLKRGVFIGAGYLNMEAASAAMGRGVDVTIVETADRPWSRLASAKLGGFLTRYYESKGAKFVFNDSLSSIEGKDGSASAVITKNGKRLEADFVVLAVGAALRTQLAEEAGLEISDQGGVLVDEYLQTSDPNIWAAGDIANFKDIALGRQWHAEHHLNAKWQGRAVGAIMAGDRKPYDQVAYFFSDFLDLHMVLRGDPGGSTSASTTVFGDLDGGEFVELYPDASGHIRMGIGVSHEEPKADGFSDKFEELIRAGATVSSVDNSTFGL